MRLENLSDKGHEKVIWSIERVRDGTRDKASQQCNSELCWRRTTATLLGVSFGSYRRRRRDVLMGRGGYVPLRRRGDVLMGRRHYVPMGRHHDIPIRRREDVPLRRLGDVPLRRHWVFHLRLVWDVVKTYHWDVLATFHWDVIGCFIWDVPATSLGRTERRRYDVATTSCCRVGIIIFLVFHFHPLMNIHLIPRYFCHLFLLDLFVITRLIADEACST